MNKQKNHSLIRLLIASLSSFCRYSVLLIFSMLISSVQPVFANQAVPMTIMTFNIENGGTQVDFRKIVEAVRRSGADVVGLQEAWGNTRRLAQALKWKYYDPALHIVSRYPLKSTSEPGHPYLLIEISPDRYVAMFNLHLPDEPYGPDLAASGAPIQAVLTNEHDVRVPSVRRQIISAAALAKMGIPVFITGDFNSPSHLDWTEAAVKANPRYQIVPWVVTSLMEKSGLIDSYRAVHPDEVVHPGYTWPAMRPVLKNTIDGFNPSDKSLPVRIDFIMAGGPVHVLQSKVIGEAGNKGVDVVVKPWPSDHRALASRFDVTPVAIPLGLGKVIPIVAAEQGKPVIATVKESIKIGEPIEINWANAPGNGNDYVRIASQGMDKKVWCQAPRLYTDAKAEGSVEYNARNFRGNRPEWCKSDAAVWPLKPGRYDIDLMLDDSNTILASTHVQVVPAE